jgi:hypothetical protein
MAEVALKDAAEKSKDGFRSFIIFVLQWEDRRTVLIPKENWH